MEKGIPLPGGGDCCVQSQEGEWKSHLGTNLKLSTFVPWLKLLLSDLLVITNPGISIRCMLVCKRQISYPVSVSRNNLLSTPVSSAKKQSASESERGCRVQVVSSYYTERLCSTSTVSMWINQSCHAVTLAFRSRGLGVISGCDHENNIYILSGLRLQWSHESHETRVDWVGEAVCVSDCQRQTASKDSWHWRILELEGQSTTGEYDGRRKENTYLYRLKEQRDERGLWSLNLSSLTKYH